MAETETIRSMIGSETDIGEIRRVAKKDGMVTLRENA